MTRFLCIFETQISSILFQNPGETRKQGLPTETTAGQDKLRGCSGFSGTSEEKNKLFQYNNLHATIHASTLSAPSKRLQHNLGKEQPA
jgi:hypothetical protein